MRVLAATPNERRTIAERKNPRFLHFILYIILHYSLPLHPPVFHPETQHFTMASSDHVGGFEPPVDPVPPPPGIFNLGFSNLDAFPAGAWARGCCPPPSPRSTRRLASDKYQNQLPPRRATDTPTPFLSRLRLRNAQESMTSRGRLTLTSRAMSSPIWTVAWPRCACSRR